jgi:hypothetical protein
MALVLGIWLGFLLIDLAAIYWKGPDTLGEKTFRERIV